MTELPGKHPPQYSQGLLIRLVRETKDREDLVKLSTLYTELEEQGDIVITHRIQAEIKAKEFSHIYRQNFRNRNN